MELIGRKRVKTIAFVSVLGYGALPYQQTSDLDITHNLVQPVLDAEPANVGGTAIVKGDGGYYSRPPEAPIEVTNIRRITGGAALPDSS